MSDGIELTVNLSNTNETNAPQPDRPPTYNVIENVNVNVVSINFSSATRPITTQQIPTSATANRGTLPPSYDEATFEQNVPPPSYSQLFGVVRETHKSSNGLVDFMKNLLILLLGTIGCTFILTITIVIPICMMVIGLIYLKDCNQCEYIPVYLLVGGAFGILKQLLSLTVRVRKRADEQELERLRQTPTQTLLNCFMLGWFIIGSFWTYSITPNFDQSSGKLYCNKNLYLFSFWLITSVYATLAVVLVILFGISCISVLVNR